jgi:hypothetical protein
MTKRTRRRLPPKPPRASDPQRRRGWQGLDDPEESVIGDAIEMHAWVA